ncbi:MULTISPECIES: enoyl-CoA hydratase-related protein [unclassified Pseudofrankia]|uniref:enoyl-CoA hydratase-related protein n=1 Tax=unclassified Pseudofrankia TaxID=2994372 RepID=UPI0008D9C685|nr:MULTISPECIES: enoyl-CoA hydratase-related protein [unclassified Pseudofrankia]MDT3444199.1 enoyl-CoA hydratase-related protein [Pseudofrankia sp. BMG5.37]OHV65235.1 enoyl-CoA hydratase [Pseudofrankia sp. BMG5.36]
MTSDDPAAVPGAAAYDSVPGLSIVLDGPVLRLTLDRPTKRNAINDTMMYGLIDAIAQAGTDEAVRVILLRGNGENFCGGADIVARNAAGGAKPRAGSIQRRLPFQAHRLIPLICGLQTPVVCAVQGWTTGIGLALAVAADVTVAAADTRFWAPFSERGFTPDSGLTWLLPRRVGEVRARRMLLLGERIDAATAVEWGLIHAAAAAEELEAAVGGVVARLAAGPTVGLGLTKWLLHVGASNNLDDQLRSEGFGMELSSRSEDFREGLAAFAAKRSPNFKGR